jgi:hypothetical protein
MPRVIHARLDAEAERMLLELERRLGWSDSQVLREGIKVLNGLTARGPRRVVGIGRSSSYLYDSRSDAAMNLAPLAAFTTAYVRSN